MVKHRIKSNNNKPVQDYLIAHKSFSMVRHSGNWKESVCLIGTYLPTPKYGQDVTQGQFLNDV